MKRNSLLISALGVAAIATTVIIYNSFDSGLSSQYVKEESSFSKVTSATDYQKWVESKMIDVETGEVITPEKLQKIHSAHKLKPKSIAVEWKEHGPNNFGGRTRSVLIDHRDRKKIWSGGVTGGLYRSVNRANRWTRVDNFPGNQMISSIAQDADGNIYVATGNTAEGGNWPGNGLYVTTDDGESWDLVEGTGNFTRINEVVATKHSNTIFIAAGNSGLRKYNHNTGNLETVAEYSGAGAYSLRISGDGEILVCGDGGSRTFVSKDKGENWENRSGTGEDEISAGAARIEYAISHRKENGQYSIYASTANANNRGQWISLNSGDTWHRHTPATEANIDNGIIDFRNQGTWNNVCSFDPTDAKRVIVGGIDLHEWKQVIDNPPSGGWNKISLWFLDPTNSLYVHADNHVLKWDDQNRLFIGNDGGIQISTDLAETFYPANRGYNIAQFFRISYSAKGDVLGGTQDNGSLYNDHSGDYQGFRTVSGGDGFSAAISFFNPDVFFSSSQNVTIYRTGNAGQNRELLPLQTLGGPFHTDLFLAEYYDEDSRDSVTFIPFESYAADDQIDVPSLSTGNFIDYTTPIPLHYDDTVFYDPNLTRIEYIVYGLNTPTIPRDLGIVDFEYFDSASGAYPPELGDSLLISTEFSADTVVVDSIQPYDFFVAQHEETGKLLDLHIDTMELGVPWDTVRVQDPYQSWFVYSNGEELWGSRDALRFSVLNPRWTLLADNIVGQVDVQFSPDLKHMFYKTGGFIGSTQWGSQGPLFRIDGLDDFYTSDDYGDDTFQEAVEEHALNNRVQVSTVALSGYGFNPNNPDQLVGTQLFNGNIYRSEDATSETPTLTSIGSQGGLAFYDVVVDRDDPDILFAATSVGASLSEDGGVTWEDVSDPSFYGTPCYHILQAWQTWDQGNKYPGEVYLGSHGRGIFSSDAVLKVITEEQELTEKEESDIGLDIFPNPARYNSILAVDLKNESNVSIQFFNLSGSVVKSINRTNMHVGRNEVYISGSELPQGTYLIRVQAGNQVETTKYIKL